MREGVVVSCVGEANGSHGASGAGGWVAVLCLATIWFWAMGCRGALTGWRGIGRTGVGRYMWIGPVCRLFGAGEIADAGGAV